MSEQYDNKNRFVLFKEENKENPKGPDYNGTINVNGTDYFIAGWVKTSKAGRKFLSGNVKAKDAPKTKAKQDEEDIPF